MSNGSSLINFGDLSKPANTFLEKISDAVGGLAKPWQIKRVAKAKAEAKRIEAQVDIEISELKQRALVRFCEEEAMKQANMEEIAAKAAADINEDAAPENMEDDWITNFFDKCRLISDEKMQTLWAAILSGEANSPGSYSKRTVNFVDSLDKCDANLFTSLCRFGLYNGDEVIPLIYDPQDEIYVENGISFDKLRHLSDIGFITFSSIGGYQLSNLRQHIVLWYYGNPIIIKFPKERENDLNVGHVLLTKTGQELAPICGSKPIPEFVEYIVEKWLERNYVPSSPWPRKNART